MKYERPDYDTIVKLAKVIAHKQYKPWQFYIAYALAVLSLVQMIFLKDELPVLSSLLALTMVLGTAFIILSTSLRVYGFMDRDMRTTSTYIRYESYGKKAFLCALGPIFCLFQAIISKPIFFYIMIPVAIVLIYLALDTDAAYSSEFNPEINGRYILVLSASLSGKSAEELCKLCDHFGVYY